MNNHPMGINIADLKYQSDHKKKPDFDWVSMLLILLAIVIVVGAIYFIFYFRESSMEELLESETILGMILVQKNGEETESILLSFYNPKTVKQAFILLPGNTRMKVDYEDKPIYDSIRNIHNRGGMSIVRKTVEQLTGLTFEHYVVYDLKDVEKLVDLLEGVEITITEAMNYTDPDRGVFINIPKGEHVLDGAKVKQLLMYRYGENGLGDTVENSRLLVEALIDRSRDIESFFESPRIAGILMDDVETSFNRKDLRILAREMQKLGSSRLLFYKMYGKNVTVEDEDYVTPVENGRWLRERIETVRNFISDDGPAPIGDEIKIEILNGSGNPGQAQSLRNYFLEYGFNVVHFGNALRNDYEQTLVIDRIGRPSLARRIADILNCREVYTRIDKTLLVDVTVILGNDFEGKYVR